MTPTCRNCNAYITAQYVRVHSRDGQGVDCCPRCPDRVRRDGQVEAARGSRRTNRDGPSWEEPARQEGEYGD